MSRRGASRPDTSFPTRETTALRNASKRDELEQPGAALLVPLMARPADDVHQHVELGDRPGRRLLVKQDGTLERLEDATVSSVQGDPPGSASARSTSASTDAASSAERMAARSSRLGMVRSSRPIAGMNLRRMKNPSRSFPESGGTCRAVATNAPLQIVRLV